MRSIPSLMIYGIVAGAVAGCGPSRLLPHPDALPKTLDGRTLWHTQHAYIYATDKTVAGETERWIADLAGYLRRAYGRDLGKGIVIVVDKDEAPFVDSLEEMARLQRRQSTIAAASPDKTVTIEELREKLEEIGMSETLACRIALMKLDDIALKNAGLSGLPEEVAWRVCCPSQRLMNSAIWEFAPVALEKYMGKGLALMTAWAWPVAFAEAAKALRLGRDVTVFEMWTLLQKDWSAGKRLTEIFRYTQERAFVISPMLSLALSMLKKDSSTTTKSGAPKKENGISSNLKQP